MKNNFILSAVVASGLLAGAVLAPAQAEEPEEEQPCTDIYTTIGPWFPIDDRSAEERGYQGTRWSETVELEPEVVYAGTSVELPFLYVAYNPPFNSIGAKSGCAFPSYIPIKSSWEDEANWSATREFGEGTTNDPELPGLGFDDTIGFLPKFATESWFRVRPTIAVEEYGQYVNVNTLSMEFPGYQGTPPSDRDFQISYNLTVVPPEFPVGNDQPDVPITPIGVSEGYDFGKVDIFDYKRGVVRIENIGTDGLVVRKAEIVDTNGDEAPEFSTTGTDCIGKVITPGRKCEVQVQFFPREQGPRAAFIKVYSNADGPLEIPLVGEGTYEKPESIIEEEEEAAANGTKPDYEVAEPEKPTIPDDSAQDVVKKKNGTYVVKSKKKKINVKWKAPDTDQPVTGYEIRKKHKKNGKWKKWKKWKDVDPMPNKKGWIKSSVKAKKDGKYKIQVTSSTPWVERGDKATVKVKKVK